MRDYKWLHEYCLNRFGSTAALEARLAQLDDAWKRIGHDRAVQGNLDPTLLLGPIERMLDGAADVLQRAGGRAGHIFNLGHGILPETPVEHVQALARFVHQRG